jgi:polyphosphate kinase
MINRDISWLSFNQRVLDEAKDSSLPLYERIKFLAIYSSNLNEFYKVRVATYRRSAADSRDLMKEILGIVDKQQAELGSVFWNEIVPQLRANRILLQQGQPLNRSRSEFIRHYFYQEVIPYLQPVLLLKGRVMPFLQNDALFPGYEVAASYSITLTRDADLGIDDEFTGDLPEKINSSLVKRKTGAPCRFLYDGKMPDKVLNFLVRSLKISREDLVPGGKYHHFSDLFSFPNPLSPRLENKPLEPLHNHELDLFSSMFEAVRSRDWMLHFPYHSYDPVVRFLNEAAIDSKVKEIKATQYRVASDSAVVNALMNARKNGKEVTVFVEVKARFDEFANLRFAKIMEKAGIRIIYSIPGLKVHAKVALVLRKTANNQKESFAFLSTGNFNEKTARI